MILQQHYAKGSVQRQNLTAAIERLQSKGPFQVPVVVNGSHVSIILNKAR